MSDRYTELYADVKRQKKNPVRNYLRDVALTALSSFTNKEHLLLPRVQILYLHHIFRDEEKNMEALLQQLAAHHTFISYSEGINRIQTGNIDRPYIVISSDDGFRNNLRAGEILKEFGVSACFFINPGITGEKSYDKIKQHCTDTLHFPTVAFLDWNDVNKLQQMGHEIGSQTMMHMNIARTPTEIVRADISQTSELLKMRCGKADHFAIPYGRFFHFSREGRKAVFDAGFTSCASAERGCHIATTTQIPANELCIRRDHIVLGWNLNHIMYFIVNNARRATVANNVYPQSMR
jgi:peptidoglycan/xylan/chitin deacetylase (PgdA/CDA1 family)